MLELAHERLEGIANETTKFIRVNRLRMSDIAYILSDPSKVETLAYVYKNIRFQTFPTVMLFTSAAYRADTWRSAVKFVIGAYAWWYTYVEQLGLSTAAWTTLHFIWTTCVGVITWARSGNRKSMNVKKALSVSRQTSGFKRWVKRLLGAGVTVSSPLIVMVLIDYFHEELPAIRMLAKHAIKAAQ